jgi:hypothetical protein
MIWAMSEILSGLISGTVFVLLGRWAYKNPKKVYPNWLYSNPDHPYLIGGVRAFATFAMFVGCFAIISSVISRLGPEALTVLAAFAGAVLGTWFLRPRVSSTGATEAVSGTIVQKKQPFFSTKGRWVIGISFVAVTLFFFGVLAFVGNSEVCQLAVKQAQSNSAVVEQLGSPIKQGLFVSGSIETTGPSGHADVSIPVSGSKAKGTLYAVGSKSAGEWTFETLRLAVGSNRVDLLDSSSSTPKPH